MPGQAATPEVSGSALLRRSFRKSFPPAVHGEGAYLWDAQGKQYLDFSGSAGVNFIGHGVAPIVAAMTAQARSLEFVDSSQFTTPVAEVYAQELLSFAGESFRDGAVYFCGGSAEALDSASKLAKQYQSEIGQGQRSQVLSDAGSKRMQNRFYASQPRSSDLDPNLDRANGSLAAIVLEPASAVAPVPTDEYLQKVSQLCRCHGILLIADETVTGVGRTGRNFGVDHWGIAPDILITAKGLSSGYAPLGAVIISKKVADAISSGPGSFIQGFSYSSHPISLAAGQAVLKHIFHQKLVEAANSGCEGTIAHLLKQNLQALRDLSSVASVGGIGLLWAVEFACQDKDQASFPRRASLVTTVAQLAVERGLLVYPVQGCSDNNGHDHILIAPPAVISPYQVSWACEQLAAAIEQASAQA